MTYDIDMATDSLFFIVKLNSSELVRAKNAFKNDSVIFVGGRSIKIVSLENVVRVEVVLATIVPPKVEEDKDPIFPRSLDEEEIGDVGELWRAAEQEESDSKAWRKLMDGLRTLKRR